MDLVAQTTAARRPIRRAASIRFIGLLGFVSLFGDMTYEGARSVVGPYFETLAASASAVGIVAGFGELVGYAIRLLSGYLGDRTGRPPAVPVTSPIMRGLPHEEPCTAVLFSNV